MQRTTTFIRVAAIAMLLGLNACKKEIIETTPNSNEENTLNADAARAGFTNYNRNITYYALSFDNRLDKYSTVIPKRLLSSATITGLQPSENILAVDFRPATGQLYGLGSTSRIYVINPTSGVARAIGAGPFTPALDGTVAGFDFNPTVDRIRIVTSSGQNLRANPETGTIAFTDGAINGQAGAVIGGVAYTNSFSGATTTTLYDIDVASNNLYIQNPPNNGTLSLVGPLGLDIEDGGFDIAGAGDAFAISTTNNRSSFVAIDLTTGMANVIFDYHATVSYRGLAIATPAIAYAVDDANNLIFFNPQIYYDANNLNTIITKPLTGLATGETVLGIDFRPLNGQLYALGSNSNVYTVNIATGAVALVSALSTPLSGTNFGFDFNPLVDRIRIISNTGQNLRFNPIDFSVLTDGSVNPAGPMLTAAAYTNNFAGTTSTTLYSIDSVASQLVTVNPPNNGTVVPVGPLGVRVNGVNGFDIGGTSGIAYTLFRGTNNRTRIYTIDLATGQATGRGIIGGNQIKGLAIGLGF